MLYCDYTAPLDLNDEDRVMSQEELIEHLHKENGQLRAENQQLRERVEELGMRLHALEGRAAKDSHTSSKPPSTDGYAKKTKSLRKASGKKTRRASRP